MIILINEPKSIEDIIIHQIVNGDTLVPAKIAGILVDRISDQKIVATFSTIRVADEKVGVITDALHETVKFMSKSGKMINASAKLTQLTQLLQNVIQRWQTYTQMDTRANSIFHLDVNGYSLEQLKEVVKDIEALSGSQYLSTKVSLTKQLVTQKLMRDVSLPITKRLDMADELVKSIKDKGMREYMEAVFKGFREAMS